MFSTNKKTGQVFNDSKPESPPLSKNREYVTEKEKKIIDRELKQEKKRLKEESDKLQKLKRAEKKAKKKEEYEKRLQAIKLQKAKVRKEIALLHGIYEHRVSVDNINDIHIASEHKVADKGTAVSLIGLR